MIWHRCEIHELAHGLHALWHVDIHLREHPHGFPWGRTIS
jgi:hypothetical protein